jgi:hypothetical protein
MQATEEERKPPSILEFSPMNTMAEPAEPETTAKGSLLEYVEDHPAASVIQALAIGFAIGMLIRLIEGSRNKAPEIDVKHKPTLDDAKFHLGSLLLPFLWPAWQKAQEGYGKSAESVRGAAGSVREAVEKAKKSKVTKEGKKRVEEAGEWAEELSEVGRKKAKEVEAWVAEEAQQLTKAGREKVEAWVEKEILPAAEAGWKKLRRFFG